MYIANPRLSTSPSRRALNTRLSLPLVSWSFLTFLVAWILFAFFVLYSIEVPFEVGYTDYRLGADSRTYYQYADLLMSGTAVGVQLIAFGGSMLGPPILAILLKSPSAIMVFNLCLFLLSVYFCGERRVVSHMKLAVILALGATTFASVVTLNKEIFALSATLLLCRYVEDGKRSRTLLVLILALGLLARWQQTAITLLYLFLRREGTWMRRHPRTTLMVLIMAITVAYPIALRRVPGDLTWATDQAQYGGTIILLNKLQASFGFFIALVPKALMEAFDRVLTPGYWFHDFLQDPTDLANTFVQNLQSIANFILFASAALSGHLKLHRSAAFFCALYVTIVAASPFIQPRYDYPIYVIMAYDMCRREATHMSYHFTVSARDLMPSMSLRVGIPGKIS